MGIHTALHQVHVDSSAKLVNFSGYCMPLHYGSVVKEHCAVRDSAAMFDISHMCILEVSGERATHWLRIMLTNDVAKLDVGSGLYTCLCLESGGVIDDLMVFKLSDYHYRLYFDSARRHKNLTWLNGHLSSKVEINEIRDNAIIAIQGPDAISFTNLAMDALGLPLKVYELERFASVTCGEWFVSRTGYSGEDGLEVTLPSRQAEGLWKALAEQNVLAAGLGARNTLRIEAGFGLYGQDIDERHSPEESGIGRTIDINDADRQFIGRGVLEDHKRFGGRYFQVGLTLEGQGVLRRGAGVELVGQAIGQVTSGSFSPMRSAAVGLARVSRRFTGNCDVTVRDRLQTARITSVPFVPHGLTR